MLYILYFLFVVILSFIAKLGGFFLDSNFYYIYPVFAVFIVIFIKIFFSEIRLFLIFNSLLYYMLAIFFYSANFSVNSYGFFSNFDDSYFYSQGVQFLKNTYVYDGPFDIFLGLLVNLGANDAFGAAAINWLFSTILLGLIYKFSKKINNNFKVYYLYILSLNYYFMESSILLFRDLLGLIFLFIAFIYIHEGKYKNKIKFNIFAVLSIMVRPMTGLVAYFYYFLVNNNFVNSRYKGKFLVIILFILIGGFFYNYIPVGIFSGGWGSSENSSFSLKEFNSNRLNIITESETDFTAKLISLGPVGMPFVMLINIFTPLRFVEYYSNLEYVYLDNGRYTINYINNILNYKGVLSTIHIFSLGFWVLPFFNGVYRFVMFEKKKYILFLFLFLLFLVSFVSFQPRHKLHFLVFLPLICSYNNINPKYLIVLGLIIDFFIYIMYFKWLL